MRFVFTAVILFAFYGANAQNSDTNKHPLNSSLKNRVKPTTLNGEPISFYLLSSKIDANSKRFYEGEIDFKNPKVFYGILDSLTVCKPEFRPFYFFVFNRIVDLSDGTLDEAIAAKCKEYIEKYSCDFFNSFNQPELDINVVRWTTLVGLNLKDKGSFAVFRGGVDAKVKASCPDTQDLLKSFMMEVRMCLIR